MAKFTCTISVALFMVVSALALIVIFLEWNGAHIGQAKPRDMVKTRVFEKPLKSLKTEVVEVDFNSVNTWIGDCVNTSSEHMFAGLEKVSTFIDNIEFPVDAAEHFLEVLQATEPFRKYPMHSYAEYGGPWIENHWINLLKTETWKVAIQTSNTTFLRKWLRINFGGTIPLFVQWTDVAVRSGAGVFGRYCEKDKFSPTARSCGLHTALQKVLRPSVMYATVVQHDCGLLGGWCANQSPAAEIPKNIRSYIKNILVFSGGGYGHIPIPLIRSTMPVLNDTLYKPASKRKYGFAYFGTPTGHAPWGLRTVLHRAVDAWAKATGKKIFFGLAKDWVSEMANTVLNLSPRGYGRASFHTYEAIQLGLQPVHIYNLDNWIPYKNTSNNLILSFRMDNEHKELPSELVQLANTITDRQLAAMEQRLRDLRDSHYTYNGTLNQILSFLRQGPIVSDLRCDVVPRTIRG